MTGSATEGVFSQEVLAKKCLANGQGAALFFSHTHPLQHTSAVQVLLMVSVIAIEQKAVTSISFCSQKGMELLDPQLRQFSDLPRWVKANAERLEGRKVLMYCTGGVRCERASAMLKSLGPGFQDVCQLKGQPFSAFPF